jgi:hypothetical protein
VRENQQDWTEEHSLHFKIIKTLIFRPLGRTPPKERPTEPRDLVPTGGLDVVQELHDLGGVDSFDRLLHLPLPVIHENRLYLVLLVL